jgi:hypothetical protein
MVRVPVCADNGSDPLTGTAIGQHLGEPLPLPGGVDDDDLIVAHGKIRIGLDGTVRHAMDGEAPLPVHIKRHVHTTLSFTSNTQQGSILPMATPILPMVTRRSLMAFHHLNRSNGENP